MHCDMDLMCKGEVNVMVWTPLTVKIANFVTEEHSGQKDKLGAPYILHLFRVAQHAETEDETCVALLHDWAEDVVPGWDPVRVRSYLSQLGVSHRSIDALLLLHHEKGEPYREYIMRVVSDDLAWRVKYWDVCDNSDPDRLALVEPLETRERLRNKYYWAKHFLAANRPENRK